ncbi:uncharacterized protein cfap97d2 [Amia ocellicauda]|uniref:uncharacterized protein cfap97d2 n=1 Tax=Amia ocellicauda TaxID=2972642 RepID=UPI0034649DAB
MLALKAVWKARANLFILPRCSHGNPPQGRAAFPQTPSPAAAQPHSRTATPHPHSPHSRTATPQPHSRTAAQLHRSRTAAQPHSYTAAAQPAQLHRSRTDTPQPHSPHSPHSYTAAAQPAQPAQLHRSRTARTAAQLHRSRTARTARTATPQPHSPHSRTATPQPHSRTARTAAQLHRIAGGEMQHRAYQPVLPCGNKYLQQKWDRADYDAHRRKVKSAKPTLNTTSPQSYGHMELKMKKLQLEVERLTIIQRDNNMLLGKISYIMRSTGRIDNRNDYEYKSLGREKRQQELLRITRENESILERISRCGPQYTSEKWREDWRRTEKLRESIARYPRSWNSAGPNKTKPKSSKKTKEVQKDKERETDLNGEREDGPDRPQERCATEVDRQEEGEGSPATQKPEETHDQTAHNSDQEDTDQE